MIQYSGPTNAPSIAELLMGTTLEQEHTVIIALDEDWKLSDMARTVGQSKQGHDVSSHSSTEQKIVNQSMMVKVLPIVTDTYNYSEADISAFLYKSRVCLLLPNKTKIKRLRIYWKILNCVSLNSSCRQARPKGIPCQCESICSILPWMLESRHPLVWFGIPGIVFFWVGFEMANELIVSKVHATVFFGCRIGCIRSDSFRCFFAHCLILYVLGKQVNRVPNRIAVKE